MHYIIWLVFVIIGGGTCPAQPSPRDSLPEVFSEDSCEPLVEEKGLSEAPCELSDENYFHEKVHVKLHRNLFLHMKVHIKVYVMVLLESGGSSTEWCMLFR